MKETKTELYALAITDIALAIMVVYGQLKPETFAVAVAAMQSVYAIARTVVKVTKTTLDDKILAKIAEKLQIS